MFIGLRNCKSGQGPKGCKRRGGVIKSIPLTEQLPRKLKFIVLINGRPRKTAV
jgi:hypothetical protein